MRWPTPWRMSLAERRLGPGSERRATGPAERRSGPRSERRARGPAERRGAPRPERRARPLAERRARRPAARRIRPRSERRAQSRAKTWAAVAAPKAQPAAAGPATTETKPSPPKGPGPSSSSDAATPGAWKRWSWAASCPRKSERTKIERDLMIEFVIGFGVFLNLMTYELIGFTAGGAVIPGYLALYLDQPGRIAGTLAAALITLAVVRGLSRVVILYGRRKFAAMLLVGFLVNWLLDAAVLKWMTWFGPMQADVRVIGFIVPGLLANDMHAQGVVQTAAVALAAAAVVRLAAAALVYFGVFGGL